MNDSVALYCKNCEEVVAHSKIEKVCICSTCGTERSSRGRKVSMDPNKPDKVPGKRGRKPALTDEAKYEAYRLHTVGLSDKAITIRLGGVSIPTVRKAWKDLEAKHEN